jgi:heme-degrading monooxygenase HmoA
VHMRVAVYTITAGTVEEIALAAEAGLLPIFRPQPGFISYRILAAQGDTCLSVSRWETHEQANAAARTAAEWVAQNLARRITLDQEHLGEVVLSAERATGS